MWNDHAMLELIVPNPPQSMSSCIAVVLEINFNRSAQGRKKVMPFQIHTLIRVLFVKGLECLQISDLNAQIGCKLFLID